MKARLEDVFLYSKRFTYLSERSHGLADEITSFFAEIINRGLVGLCESIHSPVCTLDYDTDTGNMVFDSVFSGFLRNMPAFTALASEFANTVAEDVRNVPMDADAENPTPTR